MSTNIPYAADAEVPLSADELSVLRRQYENERENTESVTTQTKFNYAWGLIKSRKSTDQQFGLRLLNEIYHDTPERRRECLYYLALGNFKLGKYTEAKSFNDKLIENEPRNLQAQSLKELIENKLKNEGIIGMMITSGIVVSAVGALMVYFKNSRNN